MYIYYMFIRTLKIAKPGRIIMTKNYSSSNINSFRNIPNNYMQLSLVEKYKILDNLKHIKYNENNYKQELINNLFTQDLNQRIKNVSLNNKDKIKINNVLDVISLNNKINRELDEDYKKVLNSIINHKKVKTYKKKK